MAKDKKDKQIQDTLNKGAKQKDAAKFPVKRIILLNLIIIACLSYIIFQQKEKFETIQNQIKLSSIKEETINNLKMISGHLSQNNVSEECFRVFNDKLPILKNDIAELIENKLDNLAPLIDRNIVPPHPELNKSSRECEELRGKLLSSEDNMDQLIVKLMEVEKIISDRINAKNNLTIRFSDFRNKALKIYRKQADQNHQKTMETSVKSEDTGITNNISDYLSKYVKIEKTDDVEFKKKKEQLEALLRQSEYYMISGKVREFTEIMNEIIEITGVEAKLDEFYEEMIIIHKINDEHLHEKLLSLQNQIN
jgi:hypothetical protein